MKKIFETAREYLTARACSCRDESAINSFRNKILRGRFFAVLVEGLPRMYFIFLFLFISACGCTEEYSRIVSLGPSITEELYLLGEQEKIVGVTKYCVRPKDAQNKEKVGTVTEIDVEKIISLRPDLVIATNLTDVKQIEKLKNIGLKVMKFSLANNFQEISSQFQELGDILNKSDEASAIISEAREKVKNISNMVKDKPRTTVFIQVGTRPLFTMTKDSFVNDYIELAGGINIAGGNQSGLYSREDVLRQNPDVIIIVGMEFAGEDEKKSWERFGQLKAVAQNRIYLLDSYKLCSPTPKSFAEMLEEMVEILHGSQLKKTGV